jgi:hypothetical protein
MHRFDARDEAIRQERAAKYLARPGPQVGDWVDFSDGTKRRISYIWQYPGESEQDIQTSGGGSWHLGKSGYASFSGSLYPPFDGAALVPTDELRPGAVWFFHHGYAGAYRGVHATIQCRVWTCGLEPPGKSWRTI